MITKVMVPTKRASVIGAPHYSPEIVMWSWLSKIIFGTSTSTSRALGLQPTVACFLKMKLPSDSSVRKFWNWGNSMIMEPLLKRTVNKLQEHKAIIHAQIDSSTIAHGLGPAAAILLVIWADEDSPIWVKDLDQVPTEDGVLLHPHARAKSSIKMGEMLLNQINRPVASTEASTCISNEASHLGTQASAGPLLHQVQQYHLHHQNNCPYQYAMRDQEQGQVQVQEQGQVQEQEQEQEQELEQDVRKLNLLSKQAVCLIIDHWFLFWNVYQF